MNLSLDDTDFISSVNYRLAIHDRGIFSPAEVKRLLIIIEKLMDHPEDQPFYPFIDTAAVGDLLRKAINSPGLPQLNQREDCLNFVNAILALVERGNRK